MTKDQNEFKLEATKENVDNEYAIIIEKAYFYLVLIKKKEKQKMNKEKENVMKIKFNIQDLI